MDRYIKWLSRELGEEISKKRAVYITMWAISFMISMLGGCAENILIACAGIFGMIFFGGKAKILTWQKSKR